jgi:hypothetical protein
MGPGRPGDLDRFRHTDAIALAQVLGYTGYRNIVQVTQNARAACFSSGQRVEDHFVEVTEMVETASQGTELAANLFRATQARRQSALSTRPEPIRLLHSAQPSGASSFFVTFDDKRSMCGRSLRGSPYPQNSLGGTMPPMSK